MKKYTLKREPIATNEPIWMGIDAHKKTLHVTAYGPSGEVLSESIPHEFKHVRGLVNRFDDCEITAVYESGPTGYRLKQWLEQLGCRAFITPVSKVRQPKGGKQIKTDERDSHELAKLAQADMLEQVHDLGEQQYRERELTRTREQLKEKRTAIGNQIKSKLLFHGIDIPESLNDRWSKKFLAWLSSGPSGNKHLDAAIEALVVSYRAIDKQIRKLKKKIDRLAKSEKYSERVQRLETIPGVGTLTAMIVLVELGDISRFDNCEEFSSFLGLIPGEWSSGDSRRKTGSVRWGNARVRTALVESSWMLIGKDPQMRSTYERIKYRRGAGRAIVAVARRLGLVMRAMLREGRDYDYPGPDPEDIQNDGQAEQQADEQAANNG